jgi:hypothetical protein
MTYDEFLKYFVSGGWGGYFAILIVGFIYGIIHFKQLSKAAQGVWIILTISLFVEVFGQLVNYFIHTNSPRDHIRFILHPLAFGYTYSLYANSSKTGRVYLMGGIVIALLSIFNSLLLTDYDNFPTYPPMLFHFGVVLATLFTFKDMLRMPDEQPLQQKGLFWFNTANLIFYASAYFRDTLYNYYLEHHYYVDGTFMPDWVIVLIKGLNYYLYSSYILTLYLDKRFGKNRKP